ncbi:Protein of unknown function DUF1997 [Macleaya cordata]|uniref:Uncharacterized protein n=1 Tax=Macleaya cordata TaxID=56857 RepID=A0A200R9C2_MACCD|nr:Protein of unknown function DUF1997 [Macleaya cordata]
MISCRVVEQRGVVLSFSNSIIPNFHHYSSSSSSSHSSTNPFIFIKRRSVVDLRRKIAAAAAAYQVTSPPPATLLSTCHIPTTTYNASPNNKIRRRRAIVIRVSNSESASRSNAKIANLSARRKETFKLPNFDDGCGRMYPISEFLTHPSAVEAVLNTNAFQSFQQLDSNTYRCTLPAIKLLKFEVSPVLDLQVTLTSEDCIVEMLSCKFEGSEAVKRHNDRFSASMRNRITWNANASEPCLDVDVKLDISLELSSVSKEFKYHPPLFTDLHTAIYFATDISCRNTWKSVSSSKS